VKILKEIEIPLPSREEQKRIMTLIKSAFNNIATAIAADVPVCVEIPSAHHFW
jgi:restriction endonuclease S subunit